MHTVPSRFVIANGWPNEMEVPEALPSTLILWYHLFKKLVYKNMKKFNFYLLITKAVFELTTGDAVPLAESPLIHK